MSDFTFQKAKKNRNEHNLPILYFNVADDWIDKLGNDAFVAWLKFYSWCDRSPERIDPDNDVVPSSLSKIMKRLGVGKKKFYNQIIRPLWNYGLIDLVEYEHSIQSGNKPLNIIVYEYPQNNRQKKYEPLEQVRDYDKDYNTSSRGFAKQGGRKNKNISSDGFQKKPGVVSHGNQGWFPEETGGGFPGKHNNDSNNINNDSNNINNDSNNIFSSSSLKPKKNDDDEKKANRIKSLQQAVKQDDKLRELAVFLYENDIEWRYIEDIVLLIHNRQIPFTRRAAVQQLEWMFQKMKTETISNFVIYFVNGLKDKSVNDKAVNKYENDYDAFWNAKINMVKKDIKENETKKKEYKSTVPFYDWVSPNENHSRSDTADFRKSDVPY
ncbi:RepA protein [Bacillus subtilis]|uniref:RepA protein n=1 Tax=Bacillus subtilis TaxID=1423 RepID=A0A0D1I6Z1_BACIU|nr:RepA protein [Bacillus subtilis]